MSAETPQDRGGRAAGWLLHGARHPGQATVEHAELGCDEELFAFMRVRLLEEVVTAHARAVRPGGTGAYGLEVLYDVLRDLDDGRLPDDATLQLLLSAYAGHPDFRTQWRSPIGLVPDAVPTTS